MSLILTDSQQVALTIQPVDKAGNPAPVESVVWASADETVITVVAAEGGLSAVAASTGKLGTTQVNVVADAKIGDGVTEITGTIDVEVKAGEAVTVNIAAGLPEEKP